MTIEQLLGMGADEIEKLKPDQLIAYFGDKLSITRPELAQQESRKSTKTPTQMTFLSPEEQAKKQKIKDIMLEMGIDTSDMEL